MKKYIHLLCLSLFIAVLPAYSAGNFSDSLKTGKNTDTLHVVGVGDIMLGTNFPTEAYLVPNNNSDKLLAPTADLLRGADITFGNLEGAFSFDAPVTKKCNDPSLCYAFRTPDTYFQSLIDAGFDMLSLANNHSGDLGAKGRKNTVRLIEQGGLVHAGLLSTPTAMVEKNGIKYGLAAFAPNYGTCNINNVKEAKRIVSELAAKADVVIVSFHGGAEGSKYQHVPRKNEMFYGESRGDVYNFSRAVIDAGADIVFGHGPHVTRAIDVYKDRFIAYSLGNFCTYSRMSLRGVNGVAPLMEVMVNSQGKFLKAQIHPVYQQKGYGPQLDAQKRAITYIQNLTKTDIPEAPLTISNSGEVLPKK